MPGQCRIDNVEHIGMTGFMSVLLVLGMKHFATGRAEPGTSPRGSQLSALGHAVQHTSSGAYY